MAKRLAILLGCCLALVATTARANTAFTMSEDQLLGRLGVSYFTTSSYFDDDGGQQKVDGMFYRDIGGHLEFRWAVLDRLELGIKAHLRHQYLTDDFVDDTETGIGDVEADTVLRLVGGTRAALGVSAAVKAPFFYDETKNLPSGDGQVDVEGRVLGAVKFSMFTIGADGGYRYRADFPADQLVYGGEVGFAYKIVYGVARLDVYSSMGNEDDNDQFRGDWMHGPDYDVGLAAITVGLKASNHWSVDLTASTVAWGRNHAAGTTLILGSNVRY